MKEDMDLVKVTGANQDGYVNIKLNDKFYIMRRPTAMEEIDIQDNNVTIEGEIDLYGYIKDILKLITPQIEMKDIVKKISNSFTVGEKTLTFDNTKAEDALKILLKSQKTKVNSDGERVACINQGETIRKIVEICDETISINDFKTKKELTEILEKFGGLFDIDGALTVFDTFQKAVQD